MEAFKLNRRRVELLKRVFGSATYYDVMKDTMIWHCRATPRHMAGVDDVDATVLDTRRPCTFEDDTGQVMLFLPPDVEDRVLVHEFAHAWSFRNFPATMRWVSRERAEAVAFVAEAAMVKQTPCKHWKPIADGILRQARPPVEYREPFTNDSPDKTKLARG